MAWVVKMTGDDGVFYGSTPDHEGLRYRLGNQESAEMFDSKEAAEAVFYWFHQIRDLQKYSLEAVLI
ncbi:hypothetical protein [Pseudomonas anguilliseptica]|uniref:Uncharacterized protein n=1 Tax=Pseudomonas anguilliseptica TaxID=53406 RepID=A0A1H5F1X0_PSEAG|nr:hypothetical protein [Pseudomonas anguilliseptica]SED97320.1 hypothetical protein SAMN05421553_3758 [Pseudomonas anguilliseptica]